MKDEDRCLSASPGLGWRCELHNDHINNSHSQGFLPAHQAGFAQWSPGEGSVWTGPQEDLREAGQKLLAGLRGNFATMDEAEAAKLAEEPSPRALAVNELSRWWLDSAKQEIGQTVAKAVEYGASDLVDIGRTLGRVAGRDLDDQQAAEWGVFFYIEGKLSRWRSAMERGERPSADTLLDIGVYARMAQRIRETGGWPGSALTPWQEFVLGSVADHEPGADWIHPSCPNCGDLLIPVRGTERDGKWHWDCSLHPKATCPDCGGPMVRPVRGTGRDAKWHWACSTDHSHPKTNRSAE